MNDQIGVSIESKLDALKAQYRNLEFHRLALEIRKSRLRTEFTKGEEEELKGVQQDMRLVARDLERLGVSVDDLALLDAHELLLSPLPAVVDIEGYVQELEISRDALAQSGSVMLMGAAGTGKTTLGAALAREFAPEEHILWLRFGGVLLDEESVLWRIAAFLAQQDLPELWRILDSERRQGQQAKSLPPDAKIRLIAKGLHELQAVVCFDDCHLLVEDHDASTEVGAVCKILQSLVADTRRYKVILMGREAIPGVKTPTTVLTGLSADASGALIARLVPDWQSGLNATLHQYLGGNPQLLTMFAAIVTSPKAESVSVLERLETLDDYVTVANYLTNELWEQLSAPERLVLQGISMFRQDAPERILRTILSEKGLNGIPDLLLDLRNRALITVTTERTSQECFYGLHEVLKRFSYNLLDIDEQEAWHSTLGVEFLDSQPLESAYHLYQAQEYESSLEVLLEYRQTLLYAGQVQASLDILERFTPPMFVRQPARWVDVLELRAVWRSQVLGDYFDNGTLCRIS